MVEISRTRLILLATTIGGGYLTWGLLIALQPPFYPSEAEKKGATPSQYGFVFGIFNMAAFISAPFFGRYGTRIGPKLMYITGAFVQALQGIAFGFLEYVQGKAAFLGLSYALRFINGVADAAALGAVLSILMKLFPNKATTILSWTEMLFGLGYMIGPALGSALYELGGFGLPFFSVGSLTLLVAIGLLFLVPNVKSDDKTDNGKKSLSFLALAKSPLISLPFLDNFICFCGIGMIESMLEPHMKTAAGATQMQVGITFLIMGGLYMVTAVVIGNVCDRIRYPTIISIAGNVMMAITFLLIGPAPFLDILPTTALIQGSIAMVGLGYGMVIVSTFGRSQRAAIRHGYQDDIETYLLISGVWSSSFYFGNFVGPTIAGFIVEAYGFRQTTVYFFALFILVIIVDICELSYNLKYVKIPKKGDYIKIEDQVKNKKEELTEQSLLI